MTVNRPGPLIEQRGQVLPLALVLVAVGGLAWIALYHVSQTATARVRLTHAADATAYSGALAQARSLNLLAYINRAEVAHQVAMAHLVTLASWAQFGHTQSQQRAGRNPPASLIRRLFGTSVGHAYAQARMNGDVVPELAQAFQDHDEVVHQVLARASASVVASMGDSRQQMMWQVLYANYPEYEAVAKNNGASPRGPLRMVVLSDGLSGYVKRHAGNEPGHLRDMVGQATSRDAFLRRRSMTRRNDWVVDGRCPTKRHELRRRGRTWLDADGRWSAKDTLSFHALRSNRWIGCYFREYAMGWGSTQYQSGRKSPSIDDPPHTFSQQDFWRWVHEHTSWDLYSGRKNSLANAYAASGALKWSSRGLPAYHELSDDAVPRVLRFAIRVQQSAMSLSTMGQTGLFRSLAGREPSHGLATNEFVTVKSAAETYFAPPAFASDRGNELASLFRPYWQARLGAILSGDGSEDRS